MKAFVIYLPDREHSVAHATYMVDTLNSYQLDAELFEGTNGDVAEMLAKKENRVPYPYGIKSNKVDDEYLKQYINPDLWEDFQKNHHYKIVQRQPLGPDIDKVTRPGVIGCFYSHYSLWKKCIDLNEPIMIFEDDVNFFRGWYPVEWEGVLILSLGKSSFLNEPYKTYLEDPVGNPQPMLWRQFSMPGASGYAIKPNAAKALIKQYREYYCPADNAINQFVCYIQIHNYIMGRNTLPEEGNISMTKFKDW